MDFGYIGDPDVMHGYGRNNPFLEDVLAAMPEDDVQSSVSSYASQSSYPSQRPIFAQTAVDSRPKNVKLPDFWAHAPELWFCRAEFRFEVAGVVLEREKFAHVVEALNYEALKLVKDLMVTPPQFQPYQALKARLLLATQLTPIQMAEKLMKAADLGDRRPSQLLASLLEFCPAGEENTSLFRAAFLMRLPAAIRGHLDGMENRDLKDLAATADHHWSNQAAIPAGQLYAAVEEEEEQMETVAAISGEKKKFVRRDQSSSTADGKWASLDTFTLCKRHQRFGRDCRKCGDPKRCQFEKMKSGN